MTTPRKDALVAQFTGAATGVSKHIPGPVMIDRITYAPVALSAVFTSAASAIEAADQKRAQWLDAVRAAKLEVARAQVVYKFFKAVVVGQFGADNETVLGDFVIPTAPQTTVLAATKAAAALKAKATREARGTKGKKQRAAIKGSVEVTITAVPLVTAPAREPPDAQK